MDCPTITVHAGKCYKPLIDSGAAISLIRYSTYQTIDHSFKTPIQTTTTRLNTADGSLMMALRITALHYRIVDFKFTHNFIMCDRLPDTELLFGIDIQKKKFPCQMPGIKKRTVTYRRMADFSLMLKTVSRRHLGILPRYNGIVPIRIKCQTIKGHMAYFINNQDSTEGKDPNINIINGIHNIKGKTSVNILG